MNNLVIEKIFRIKLASGLYDITLQAQEKNGLPHIIHTKDLEESVSLKVGIQLSQHLMQLTDTNNGIVIVGKDLSEEKRIISIFKNDDKNPHSVRILFNDEINLDESGENGVSLWLPKLIIV